MREDVLAVGGEDVGRLIIRGWTLSKPVMAATCVAPQTYLCLPQMDAAVVLASCQLHMEATKASHSGGSTRRSNY